MSGDKTDNRLDNLELWFGGHPSGIRGADINKAARSVISDAVFLIEEVKHCGGSVPPDALNDLAESVSVWKRFNLDKHNNYS